MTDYSLRVRNLPDPQTLIHLMAIDAARLATYFSSSYKGAPYDTGAQPHGWYYSDGGGSWAQLIQLTNDRSVLVGCDHSDSLYNIPDPRRGLPNWAARLLP